VYALRVTYGDVTWIVMKRFSELFDLDQHLHTIIPENELPEFPSRHPKLLHDPDFLKTRQKELENYFVKLLDTFAYQTDQVRNFFGAFTELDKHGVELKPRRKRLEEIEPNAIYCTSSKIKYYGVDFPLRMIVIKLQNQNLLLYSPTNLDDATILELNKLGKVKFILAPNKAHYNFLFPYTTTFPEAVFYLAPGVKEKVPFLTNNWHVLSDKPDPEWAEEVDQILTIEENSYFKEVLLFHKTSKSLIVADYVENLPPEFWSSEGPNGLNAAAITVWYDSDKEPVCSHEHSTYCTDVSKIHRVSRQIIGT